MMLGLRRWNKNGGFGAVKLTKKRPPKLLLEKEHLVSEMLSLFFCKSNMTKLQSECLEKFVT